MLRAGGCSESCMAVGDRKRWIWYHHSNEATRSHLGSQSLACGSGSLPQMVLYVSWAACLHSYHCRRMKNIIVSCKRTPSSSSSLNPNKIQGYLLQVDLTSSCTIFSSRGDVVEIESWVGAAGKNGMRRDWIVRDFNNRQVLARSTRYIYCKLAARI